MGAETQESDTAEPATHAQLCPVPSGRALAEVVSKVDVEHAVARSHREALELDALDHDRINQITEVGEREAPQLRVVDRLHSDVEEPFRLEAGDRDGAVLELDRPGHALELDRATAELVDLPRVHLADGLDRHAVAERARRDVVETEFDRRGGGSGEERPRACGQARRDRGSQYARKAGALGQHGALGGSAVVSGWDRKPEDSSFRAGRWGNPLCPPRQ
ncbi:MAG: hypothetical protein ACPGVZ_12490 [Myxococcota bacterium]